VARPMHVTNSEIAAVFAEIADWLELDAENPFRIHAYRNAARTIEAWPGQLAGMPHEPREFAKLPGIGNDLGEKIGEILRSGTCSLLVRLRKSHPRGLTELLKVPGIGARRVARLHRELGITTLSGLVRAARARRISTLKGFGRRSEDTMLQAALAHLGSEQRWPISVASQHADAITAYLSGTDAVLDIAVAGSFRRRRETVGDLDVLVSSRKPAQAAARFLAYPPVAHVLARGNTRCSAILKSGLQIDLRVVAPHSFGAALVYFTGSKAHTIALRRGARQRGLKINEYGVYRGAKRIAGTTEADVYAAVGLPMIAPELREDRGEIQAARENRLPQLVQLDDLRGDLHAHTNASDGHASIAQMAAAAKSAGLSYLAITDHSRGLGFVHGIDAGRLLRQIDAIDRFNTNARGTTVLKGIEVEILEDGRLGLPDDVLARLDLVVAAVHSHFHLSRMRQTTRILRAMDHPCFSVLAHPTGRLIGERAPYDVDIERVIRHARDRACFLELNAQPSRLDLDDVQARMAADAGVPIAIASDAHDVNGFAALRFGIDQARRAWVERRHVVNTLPLAELRRRLAATMHKRPLAA
jgi:DNA polymerase (family 10)